MAILTLTENPKKAQEYAEHFALYGVKQSLEVQPYGTPEEIKAWLLTQDSEHAFAIREEADLYLPDCGNPISRPYRVASNDGAVVLNKSKATVYSLSGDGELTEQIFEATIPGKMITPDRPEDPAGFDWDDVFAPDKSSTTYQEAKSSPGKVSARSLVLDDIITSFLPFKSIRAFKYGRLNKHGLVDLNCWPLDLQDQVQFDVLPIDFYEGNSFFQKSALSQNGVGRLLANALKAGAHFRTASNRREWLYWAPGINAGIPLTPKEDPAAELIYLAHDFAHYAMPDLLVDTPKDKFADQVIVAHRMIGETMAMVTADMFVMDAFVRAGHKADAQKHGIYAILENAKLDQASEKEAFTIMLKAAVEALLTGKHSQLDALMDSTPENTTLRQKFMSKYSKFALADYEWTHLNLQEVHKHQDRQDRWIAMFDDNTLAELGLIKSSTLVNRIASPALEDASFEAILWSVLEDTLQHELLPKMDEHSEVARDEVLNLSLRRYFAGQIAFYARYPRMKEEGSAYGLLSAAVADQHSCLDDPNSIRKAFNEDLKLAEQLHMITPIDRKVFGSVFPIVRPHYVSYANPNYTSYQDIFQLIRSEEK